jgi:hypothetical protein
MKFIKEREKRVERLKRVIAHKMQEKKDKQKL